MPLDSDYFAEMLFAAREARLLIAGQTRETFSENRAVQYAVMYMLVVLGEAASRARSDFERTHADLPWRVMIGLRNRLVHDHFKINRIVVWKTVEHDLPSLIASLERITLAGS